MNHRKRWVINLIKFNLAHLKGLTNIVLAMRQRVRQFRTTKSSNDARKYELFQNSAANLAKKALLEPVKE